MDIIAGMSKTIKNSSLKSILLELSIERPDYKLIIELMDKSGFKNYKICNQALVPDEKIKNHIFSR